ncbi:PREDICTED: cholinesterase 1-like [Branchiostoma belcheri]|uniref:Carboxylic ester hydrolase n=1 Tax=Branchiostoma belcheri TaxID=7741 RepID=A0A6P5AF77_BRABE|nr:PREDICTED: cholinesterase 1-like [Branchiostoma belcheri]
MTVYIIAAVCAAMLRPVTVQAAADVTAPAGRLVGLEQDVFGTTVHAFLGIPYAHPPVGDGRFRRAERLPPWDGVYNATTYPDMCIQASNLVAVGGEITQQSEDCLYLSVWQPDPVPTRAAVMVWIHGGGFRTGSSAQYTGKYLTAAEGVIVVTVNYRVGPLGFLCTGTDDAPGNMGLTDQLLALQWVQDNIPSFGGDASRVTIFGHSAGASSVGFHLLSPASRNVFSRAILQSGTAVLPGMLDTMSDATDKATGFSESLGCPTEHGATALLTCLRSRDEQQFATFTMFQPVVDNNFIPTNPSDALNHGMFKKADILIGTNPNEFVFFFSILGIPGFSVGSESTVDREQFLQTMNAGMIRVPELNALALEAVEFQYTDWLHPDKDTRYRDILDAARGDYSFVCPAVTTARAHARHGAAVYMYRFAHRVTASPWPDWVVATHGDELQFVFGLPTIPDVGYSTEDAAVSHTVMRYWANFAKTGNPNNDSDNNFNGPVWSAFTETDRAYMFLDGSGPRMMGGLKTTECALWDVYVPSLINKTDPQDPVTPEPAQCQTTAEVSLPTVWGQSLTLALFFSFIKDVLSFITAILAV